MLRELQPNLNEGDTDADASDGGHVSGDQTLELVQTAGGVDLLGNLEYATF